MSGNEYELDVYFGKNIIAKLTLIDDQLHWQYNRAWQQSGYALSPHLSLNSDIPTLNVQRFLRNFLPEGHCFDELVTNFHLSRRNTFGLMRALGLDIPGSLIMLPSQHSLPDDFSFRAIPDNELEKRLDNRDQFSLLVWDGKPRLSVAGVQEKINVVLDNERQLGLGEGSLCSTHILKFEKQKLSHLVLNEYITMQLARQCGLSVANVELMRYGKHPALLVERFDRHLISMTEVNRRHVIDGCQTLNLPPEYKYERNFGSSRDVAHIRDGASLVKLFDVANQCANPALAKQQMLRWVLFNLLVFNYDAHGKNISFYVNPDGLELAPFYDLVNIKMYPHFEHEMAMALGDEFDGKNIHAYQLADFADSCNLPRSFVATNLNNLIEKLRRAFDSDIGAIVCNDEESRYLEEYQKIIYKRCEDLLKELDNIVSIEL